jgi:hypothetical protein
MTFPAVLTMDTEFEVAELRPVPPIVRLLISTVPKSASGKMLPELLVGVSSIHSADVPGPP